MTITVAAPNETLGPPGYYTLWVVESTEASPSEPQHLVPSTAAVVRFL